MQTNKDHCEIIHGFIFWENVLFVHQSFKITFRCKISDYTELLLIFLIFIYELIKVLNDERIIIFFQFLEFLFIAFTRYWGKIWHWNFEKLSCILIICFIMLNLIYVCILTLTNFIIIKWDGVCADCSCLSIPHFLSLISL